LAKCISFKSLKGREKRSMLLNDTLFLGSSLTKIVQSLITRPSVTVHPRKILGEILLFVPNGITIISQCGLGDDMSQI